MSFLYQMGSIIKIENRGYRRPVSTHLVEQAEQEVSPAELEVSEDLWTDACCPGETTGGSASPARCRLRFPYGGRGGEVCALLCHFTPLTN